VSAEWRELLESAETYPGNEWFRDYYLGVAQWAAGDRAQAVRSWERSLAAHPSPWVLRALAVAEDADGERDRAAERYLAAHDLLRETFLDRPEWTGQTAAAARDVQRALTVEAVPALLAAGRPLDADRVLDQPAAGGDGVTPLDSGHLRLLRAQTALARGDAAGARALFDEGFEVSELHEGVEALSDTWYAIAERLLAGDGPVTDELRAQARTDHPLPAAYDFRMRPES
jgi:tetratricopeptide (TPR) repeat protein